MALEASDLIRAALPPGGDRERLLRLVRIAEAFERQQRGRRPGALRRHVEATVARMPVRTFEALLRELEFDALRHRLQGETPIVRVDRREEVVRYVEAGVEREAGFARLRNIARLRNSPVPLSREADP